MQYRLVLLVVTIGLSPRALALGPDDLLLVTNKNVPESRALAEFYAEKRHVPAGRIVELDVPFADEISADAYDAGVVAPLRDFLAKHDLGKRVTCLVTFYGMPLHVEGRQAGGPPERGEDAALDSELALLRWEGRYARRGWVVSPMRYSIPAALRAKFPPVVMTARLDAPRPELVRQMILDGLKAEAEGLRGKVVIDAGGNLTIDAKNPSYAAFDNVLKNLATIVRTKTSLPLVLDEKPEVLPAGSAKEVALYCGWYSLQHYVPACTFVPGAVGFHVASFEMTSLRKNPRQWVAGLLGDGITATLGPVNEPFLSAFPRPDEFFPLLMTGKLTLAEVYWKTNLLVSWRIGLIGDPLYNPFKAKPALAVEALPEALRSAVGQDGR